MKARSVSSFSSLLTSSWKWLKEAVAAGRKLCSESVALRILREMTCQGGTAVATSGATTVATLGAGGPRPPSPGSPVPTRVPAAPVPVVQLLGSLDKAGVVGLLQHLLGVTHHARVLQHGLVLLDLAVQAGQPLLLALLDRLQQGRPLLLQHGAQPLDQLRHLLLGLRAVHLPSTAGSACRTPPRDREGTRLAVPPPCRGDSSGTDRHLPPSPLCASPSPPARQSGSAPCPGCSGCRRGSSSASPAGKEVR